MTTTVETYHSAIRKLVAERFAASAASRGRRPSHDRALELTREDFEKIEADLLATGYRFEMSAVVSLQEEPDKYQPVAGVPTLGQPARPTSRAGSIVGTGDNVFKAQADVTGTARFVSDVETVMEMLTEGVPGGHGRDHRRLRRHADRADPRRLHRPSSAWAAPCAPTSASSPASTACPA